MSDPNFPSVSSETLLRLHESYLKSIDSTIDRRYRYNWVMTFILGSILVGLAYLQKDFSDNPSYKTVSIMGMCLALALCFIWIATLCSFQSLIAAKFKVLQNVEADIGAKLHGLEEDQYRGLSYVKLTAIEMLLPILASIGIVALMTLVDLGSS